MYLLAEITAPSFDWAQFGLAGAVIAALFWTMRIGVKQVTEKFDVIDKRHDERCEKMNDDHSTERETWRQDMVNLVNKFTNTNDA